MKVNGMFGWCSCYMGLKIKNENGVSLNLWIWYRFDPFFGSQI